MNGDDILLGLNEYEDQFRPVFVLFVYPQGNSITRVWRLSDLPWITSARECYEPAMKEALRTGNVVTKAGYFDKDCRVYFSVNKKDLET